MSWHYTPYALLSLVVAVMSGALALYVWRRRGTPGGVPLVLLMAAITVWAAAYALELSATGLPHKVLWAKVEYLGIVTVPLAWLAFALQYTGREAWLGPRRLVLLGVLPLGTLLLVWTNEAHGLVWSETALDTSGPFVFLDLEHGPAFWAYWAYSYVLILLGTGLMVSTLIRSPGLYSKQSGALLFAAFAPWLGNGLYVLGLNPLPNLDLTPFAFLLSGVAITWALFRWRLLDIVPVARAAVVEGLSDGVVVLDSRNRIVDLNPAARSILGLPDSGAIGLDVEQVASAREILPDLGNGAAEMRREVELGTGPGRRYYEVEVSPLRERRKGAPSPALIVLHDVTERKRSEEEIRQLNETLENRVVERTAQLEAAVSEIAQSERMLRESEERFRSLVRNASDLIIVLDAAANILYESPAVERVLGYRPEERVGNKAFDLLHPDDVAQVRSKFARLLQAPDERLSVEYRVRDRAGRWRHFEAIGANLLSDPAVQGIVVNSREITERKRAEAALREGEERYRAVVEQAAEGILLVDVDSKRILEANAAYHSLLGYYSGELTQLTLYDVVPYSRDDMDCYIRRVRERRSYVSGERQHRRKDGSLVDVEVRANVISYGGHEAICILVRDITAIKKTEAALREMRQAERNRIARDLHDGVLQDLAYTVQSIEFARINAWGTGLEEGLQEPLKAIRGAVQGLREAVYDLRLGEEQNQPFPWLLESLLTLHRRMAPEREISLEVEEGFPQEPLGERGTEILRITQEALTNARRHSGARRIALKLRTTGEDLQLEVTDDGCGFDQSSTRPGVGLKSMRERAAALSGSLEIESEPSSGTTVRISAPLRPA
jgi:PAS domain S-box-containing protein